ncbi:hypothetical protein D1007_51385 [Hordeum vulgare]|nr:hypothetical protein D1007_51385 [Hordeum vulgare]
MSDLQSNLWRMPLHMVLTPDIEKPLGSWRPSGSAIWLQIGAGKALGGAASRMLPWRGLSRPWDLTSVGRWALSRPPPAICGTSGRRKQRRREKQAAMAGQDLR